MRGVIHTKKLVAKIKALLKLYEGLVLRRYVKLYVCFTLGAGTKI